MKKGDLVELEIEKYAFEGKGISKIRKSPEDENRFVVFVERSYPGDKVKAKIGRVKKSYAEAKAFEIISPSPERTTAGCIYFGTCGGCRQQDLSYEAQLKYKQQQVEEIFLKMGGLKDFGILPIIPSGNIYYYRNKMEFSFSDKRWFTEDEIKSVIITSKDFALGLHVPGVYDKVLDIKVCYLQSELSVNVLNFTREFFKERKTSPYSVKDHTGFLRNLVIRQAFHTPDFMVNIVTAEEDDKLIKSYTAALLNNFPGISTIVNNVNKKKAAVAEGDYEIIYHGEGFITEMIGNYTFRISANSFFQTNTLQAEKLYQTALDFAELKGDEIIYDLYSGAGTIAAFISGEAGKVFAFESSASAIADAGINIEINRIKNVESIHTDLIQPLLPVINERGIPAPDLLIVDPPRSGMHNNTVEDVVNLSPGKIVYVSCNPATQVRDIKLLTESGYKLVKIRPVDMFPHTYHIENVSLLVKEQR